MRRIIALLSTVVAVAASAHTPASAASDATITVVGFAFSPATVTVDLDRTGGNDITFINRDAAPHEMRNDPHGQSSLEGTCFDSDTLGLNERDTVRISYSNECLAAALSSGGIPEPGFLTIAYHCHLHPAMEGTIRVRLA